MKKVCSGGSDGSGDGVKGGGNTSIEGKHKAEAWGGAAAAAVATGGECVSLYSFIFIYFISFSFVFNSDHYFRQQCRGQQPRRRGQQGTTKEERTAAEGDVTAAEAAEQEEAMMRIELDGGFGAAI